MAAWTWLEEKVLARKAQLRFCLRLTAAALLSFALMQFWTLPLRGLWAVLTAVVLMQSSIGGSLRATSEYVIGTCVGAVYASIVGILIPQTTALMMMGVLALAVAPLAYLAALSPSFRVAPFTAIIVLLLSGQFGQSPVASAFTRSGEVVLGGVVAILVSLFVLPERAHGLGLTAARNALNQLADVLPKLLEGFTRPIPASDILDMQNSVGQAVTAFETVTDEARRERLVGLASQPDPDPFSRTLLRLRHDLVIIGRAASTPLPEIVAERLNVHLAVIGEIAAREFRACADAVAARQPPPGNVAFETAIDAFAADFAAIRREGLIRPLSGTEAEQLFALSFALEQLRQNFRDLTRAIRDWESVR
jgi:uncharacterized membrane protein YccC